MFIVDAYNLAYSEGFISFDEAYNLALKLSNALMRNGYRVLFVFDGYTDIPHPSYIKFSGEGVTADDWILKYLSKHRGETVKLVTRDKSLAGKARHVHPNLFIIDPKDFLKFVDRLSSFKKTPSDKVRVYTQDVQESMLESIEDFLTSLKKRKRRRQKW